MLRSARKPLGISIALLFADFLAAFLHVSLSQVKRQARRAYESSGRGCREILALCRGLFGPAAKPACHGQSNVREWPVETSKTNRTAKRK
jgi:hypothetical protein